MRPPICHRVQQANQRALKRPRSSIEGRFPIPARPTQAPTVIRPQPSGPPRQPASSEYGQLLGSSAHPCTGAVNHLAAVVNASAPRAHHGGFRNTWRRHDRRQRRTPRRVPTPTTPLRRMGLRPLLPNLRRLATTTPRELDPQRQLAPPGDHPPTHHGDCADTPGGSPMRLANLPTAETITATRVRRGPSGACDIYGDGDLDDWRAVENLRRATCWADAQRAVDQELGTTPIDFNKFRYHWRKKCWHWTEEQRQAEL